MIFSLQASLNEQQRWPVMNQLEIDRVAAVCTGDQFHARVAEPGQFAFPPVSVRFAVTQSVFQPAPDSFVELVAVRIKGKLVE